MNYYPFHVGDYAAHTAHLDLLEDLAYRRMLDMYYLRECALPHDPAEVARLIRMRGNVAEVTAVLREFFTEVEGGWVNGRCDEEILRMQDKQMKARASAEASVAARRAKAEGHRSTPAERTLNERSTDAELPTPTPTPTPTPINTPDGVGAPRKRSTATALAARPDDVSEPVWQDFQRLRREKRAPLTDTALAGVRREAEKAGVSMETALAYCCEAGWQGFNAGWYADRQGAGGRGVAAQAVETYAQRAARQRMEEVAPMAARKQPGSAFDAAQRFMQGEVIDVAAVPKQLARVV